MPDLYADGAVDSWKQKLFSSGYVHLEKDDPVLSMPDLVSTQYVWCFCDILYLSKRYEKCPRCGIPKGEVQLNV